MWEASCVCIICVRSGRYVPSTTRIALTEGGGANRFPGIAVANAPVSFGAFELTVGIDPDVPNGLQVLDEVKSAGYAGIDLGPVGYLGAGRELGERLAARNLGLAGAYLELPYADHQALDAAMPALDDLLDAFDAVRPYLAGPAPRPTLADSGDARTSPPGRGSATGHSGSTRTDGAASRSGSRGPWPAAATAAMNRTFHHETGTYVEAPWEIERVLELSDIGLCLDTGHLLLGGGDPVRALADWGSRINQVHLKDARRSVMDTIIAEGAPTGEIWTREVFPPLGGGDLDVDGVLDGLPKKIICRDWLKW